MVKESIEQLDNKREEKELEETRGRFREWREEEIKKIELETKEKNVKKDDFNIRLLKSRLESIKEKELGKSELEMFEIFEKFLILKEPEEDFNWKEFQALHEKVLEEIRSNPNNSKMITINLLSEKLQPLIIKRQKEEENL